MKHKIRRVWESAATFSKRHKIWTGLILIILLGVGYYAYGKITNTSGETRYILGTVSKGTIISSVSASGQVAASNQVDIKPKASGDITYLAVKAGQKVSAGALIASIDPSDALKSVRDAKANLESAQISHAKLTEPADALTKTQAENALTQATNDLAKNYDVSFNDISNTYLDLPSIMTGLQSILYGSDISHGSKDNISAYSDSVQNVDAGVTAFRDDAAAKYRAARTAYDASIADYKNVSRASDKATIEKMLNETYTTTKTVAEAVKSTNDLLNFVKDRMTTYNINVPTQLGTSQNSLSTYTSETNSHVTTLANDISSLTTGVQSITEKRQSLDKINAGADPLDVQSSNLSVTKAENALADAESNLADYSIRAPFSGVLASVAVKNHDSVSSGSAVATLITDDRIAELSLNEVDAAKIKVGDKVTLTFDAIDGLSLTGSVAEIDSLGTVTQGVVSYTVKVGFDTQSDEVKPGMTVNANIITEIHQNVLTVPSSAVKTQNGASYVMLFNPPISAASSTDPTNAAGILSATLPENVPVEVGISDDTNVEIISGLSENEQIVTKTTTGTAAAVSGTTRTTTGSGTTRNAGFGAPGIRL